MAVFLDQRQAARDPGVFFRAVPLPECIAWCKRDYHWSQSTAREGVVGSRGEVLKDLS